MDFDLTKFLGKHVAITTRNKLQHLGSIQATQGDKVIYLLTLEQQDKLRKEYGDTAKWNIEYDKALQYLVAIECCDIVDISPLEAVVSAVSICTQGGKKADISGVVVEFANTRKVGYLRTRYKFPDCDKWFDLGDVRITDGELTFSIVVAFISYAKEDRERVLEVTRTLHENGIATWFDEDVLLPGDPWKRKVESAIESADYFLLFLSSTTVGSEGYKNREFLLAQDRQSMQPQGKRFIIPILLDECAPPRELKDMHWLKIYEEGWQERLFRAIQSF